MFLTLLDIILGGSRFEKRVSCLDTWEKSSSLSTFLIEHQESML